MYSFTLIDELGDFANELIYLIKQDWEKFKLFVKEYKKYVFWVVVLLITMQFTDLMSLGSSWDKYCSKNGIQNRIQTGGGGESYAPVSEKGKLKQAYTDSKAAQKKATKQAKATKKDKSTEGMEKHKKATEAAASARTSKQKAKQSLKSKAYKQGNVDDAAKVTRKADQSINSKQVQQQKAMALSGSSGDGETKDIDKKVGWFKKFKANKGTSPVFGNCLRQWQNTAIEPGTGPSESEQCGKPKQSGQCGCGAERSQHQNQKRVD
jgi:hypothetical protein